MPGKLQDEYHLYVRKRQVTDSIPIYTDTTPTPAPTDSSTFTTESSSSATTTTPSSSSTTPTTTSSSESTASTSATSSATSTSAPASISDVTTSQAQSTSMVSTTAVVVTNGSTITTVTATQTIISPGHSSNKSTNTGAIVGGVVGGIGGLAILILLFWFLRRKSKKIELDGDIFDPDRNADRPGRLHGDLDLSEPQMLPRPYNYQPASTGGAAAAAAAGGAAAGAGMAGVGASRYSQSHHNQPSVAPGELYPRSQYPYGQYPYPPAGGAGRPQSAYLGHAQGAGSAKLNRGPSDSSAYGGMAPSDYPYSGVTSPVSGSRSDGAGASDLAAFPAGVTQYTSSTSSSAAAKAQQAAEGRRMHVANDEVGGDGPVVQHQDGGRPPATQDTPSPPTEVPPAYDSIPREEAGPSGAGPSNDAREEAARPEKSARPLSN